MQAVRGRRNCTQGILAPLIRSRPHGLTIVEHVLPVSAIDTDKYSRVGSDAIRGVADWLLASDLEATGLSKSLQPRLERLGPRPLIGTPPIVSLGTK